MISRKEQDAFLRIVSNGQRGLYGAIAMLKESVNVDLREPRK